MNTQREPSFLGWFLKESNHKSSHWNTKMVYAFVHKFIIIAFIMSCIFNMTEVTVAGLGYLNARFITDTDAKRGVRPQSVIYIHSFQILILMYI
jgi:hypothetical protein